MTMNLFTFGHPCEHQLKRTCIGGTHCPLNGYPDDWCCSFVKGKINFKRDKPCEGARCRWGFEHPTNTLFDSVTTVLNDGRALAQRLDEAASSPNEILTFKFSSAHYLDTVHCTVRFLRATPAAIGHKLGQLMACAALRSHDARVFTQLLKTMRKPVDPYLLGAHDYTVHHAAQLKAKLASGKKVKNEDVCEELRSDIVDVMNSALSQHGVLVDRADQRELQAVFVAALHTFPPKNKRKREMLESALSRFAPKPAGEDTRSTAVTAPAKPGEKPGEKPVEKPVEKPGGKRSGPNTPQATAVTAPPPPPPPEQLDRARKSVFPSPGKAPAGAAAPTLPPPSPGGASGSARAAYASVLAGSGASVPPSPQSAAAAAPPLPASLDKLPREGRSGVGARGERVEGICAALMAKLTDGSNQCAGAGAAAGAARRAFTPIPSDAPLLPDIAVLGGLFALRSGRETQCGLASAVAAAAVSAPPQQQQQQQQQQQRGLPPRGGADATEPGGRADSSFATSSAPATAMVGGSSSGGYALFGPHDGFGAVVGAAGGGRTAAQSAAGGGSAASPHSSLMMEGVLSAWNN